MTLGAPTSGTTMWLQRTAAFVFLALGCVRGLAPEPAGAGRIDPLEALTSRVLPTQLVAKFQLRLQTRERSVTVPAVVVLDRPMRGHLALLNPLGSPLATLSSDGEGVAIALARGREHYVSPHADAILRDTTGEALGIADLFGLVLGDPPFDPADAKRRPLPDGGIELTWAAPGDKQVSAAVGVDGTLTRVIAADRAGIVELQVDYARYTRMSDNGPLVPEDLTVYVPPLQVSANLHAKSWTIPDEVPAVFDLAPPVGFVSRPLEDLVDPFGALEGEIDP